MAKLIVTNDYVKTTILIELDNGSQVEFDVHKGELMEALKNSEQTEIMVNQSLPIGTRDILDNADDDLREVLENNIDDLVESHLESWKERYYRKSIDDISFDLYVNHDISLEIEFVEEKLDRKLKDGESEIIERFFNESVLDDFRN